MNAKSALTRARKAHDAEMLGILTITRHIICREITCPRCGTIMDVNRAIYYEVKIDGDPKLIRIACGRCAGLDETYNALRGTADALKTSHLAWTIEVICAGPDGRAVSPKVLRYTA